MLPSSAARTGYEAWVHLPTARWLLCSCGSTLIRLCSFALLVCSCERQAISTVASRAVVYKARGPTVGNVAAGHDASGADAGNAAEETAGQRKESTPGRPEVIATLAAAMTEACVAADCQDVKVRQLVLIFTGF